MGFWPQVTAGSAALMGIYADLAYNVMSATNSSPQTTELFAGARADTLWKYVKLGDAQIAVLAAAGGLIAQKEAEGSWVWPVLGAVATMAAMHLMYAHALASGQASAGGGSPRPAPGALWGRGR